MENKNISNAPKENEKLSVSKCRTIFTNIYIYFQITYYMFSVFPALVKNKLKYSLINSPALQLLTIDSVAYFQAHHLKIEGNVSPYRK